MLIQIDFDFGWNSSKDTFEAERNGPKGMFISIFFPGRMRKNMVELFLKGSLKEKVYITL